MSASQRRKGQAGEREAAKLLTELLGVDPIQRQLDQARDGGADLTACGIAIEVKRSQQVRLSAALDQVASACADGQLGAVMHRSNRDRWRITMSIEDWCSLVRESL